MFFLIFSCDVFASCCDCLKTSGPKFWWWQFVRMPCWQGLKADWNDEPLWCWWYKKANGVNIKRGWSSQACKLTQSTRVRNNRPKTMNDFFINMNFRQRNQDIEEVYIMPSKRVKKVTKKLIKKHYAQQSAFLIKI